MPLSPRQGDKKLSNKIMTYDLLKNYLLEKFQYGIGMFYVQHYSYLLTENNQRVICTTIENLCSQGNGQTM